MQFYVARKKIKQNSENHRSSINKTMVYRYWEPPQILFPLTPNEKSVTAFFFYFLNQFVFSVLSLLHVNSCFFFLIPDCFFYCNNAYFFDNRILSTNTEVFLLDLSRTQPDERTVCRKGRVFKLNLIRQHQAHIHVFFLLFLLLFLLVIRFLLIQKKIVRFMLALKGFINEMNHLKFASHFQFRRETESRSRNNCQGKLNPNWKMHYPN